MPRALPVDLRRRVIAAIEAGASCRQTGKRFDISASSAIRRYALSKGENDITAATKGRPPVEAD